MKLCKAASGANSATDRDNPWDGTQLDVPARSVSFHLSTGSSGRKKELLLNVKTRLGKVAYSPFSAIKSPNL